MRVPSYDDLAPPIPDVSLRDTFAQVDRLWSPGAPLDPARAAPGAGPAARFACLRSPRAAQAIAGIARDFSPRVEQHGPACVVFDVGGLTRLLGDAHAIGAEIERSAVVRGGSIRVAVAPTQTAAMLLTIACPGLTVATGDPSPAVAALPISTLRDWLRSVSGEALGSIVGPGAEAHVDTFERWGLHSLGEVAALPSADLSQRMGRAGVLLQRLARGLDARPLVPDPDVPRFAGSLELEWPIDALEPLSFMLARLLDPLSTALERAGRGAAAIRLDLRLVDRTSHARTLLLPAAMRDARVLRTLLLLDLESHPPPAAIDVVTVELDPAPSRIVQFSLLERAVPSPETIATLTARLNALVGETRCGSPALLDTHRPDGFELRPFSASSSQLPAAGFQFPASSLPRVPLRRFRPAIAIRVTVDRGRPAHVFIDRRGMPGGRVERHAGPWRTSGGWWDAADTGWDRDEWDIAFSDGSYCRLFRDRTTGGWFIEGVLD